MFRYYPKKKKSLDTLQKHGTKIGFEYSLFQSEIESDHFKDLDFVISIKYKGGKNLIRVLGIFQ